jgi:site-specific DNA-methyltransferase (adenine-specific)
MEAEAGGAEIRIVRGDCAELLREVPDGEASLVLADPPYNVYGEAGSAVPQQRRNKEVGWDGYDADFVETSLRWIEPAMSKLRSDGSLFLFGGVNYRRGGDLLDLLPALRGRWELVNLIVWHYPSGSGAERFFSNRFELLAWVAKSRDYRFYLDAVRVGYDRDTLREYLRDPRLDPEKVRRGKNPTNVWEIPRVHANSKERTVHPTQKPEELVRRVVRAVTLRGDLVLAPFSGSGTTAKVCQDLGRRCLAFELRADYVRMARRRLRTAPKLRPSDPAPAEVDLRGAPEPERRPGRIERWLG